MKRNFIWVAARVFLGAVFILSGFSKLLEPAENFRAVIAAYELIPPFLIPPAAWILPWAELLFGCFIVVGYAPRISALFLAGLSGSFMVLIATRFLLFGDFVDDCGCFGSAWIHFTGYEVFFLDLLCLLLGLRLWRMRNHPMSLDQWLKIKKGMAPSCPGGI